MADNQLTDLETRKISGYNSLVHYALSKKKTDLLSILINLGIDIKRIWDADPNLSFIYINRNEPFRTDTKLSFFNMLLHAGAFFNFERVMCRHRYYYLTPQDYSYL